MRRCSTSYNLDEKNPGILDTLLKWPLLGQPKELEIYAPVSTVVLLAVYSPSIGRLMSSEQREEQLFAKFQFLMCC